MCGKESNASILKPRKNWLAALNWNGVTRSLQFKEREQVNRVESERNTFVAAI